MFTPHLCNSPYYYTLEFDNHYPEAIYTHFGTKMQHGADR